MRTKHSAIYLRVEEMTTPTIIGKLKKAEVDMGIITYPVNDPDLLEIPLYHERFFAYVSPMNPAYAQDSIRLETLIGQPIWIIKDGLRQLDPSDWQSGGEITYERFFEGGRVGLLIQIVNENGGVTIIPETHVGNILLSQRKCLRPIVDPERSRTISLVVRADFIHEAKLNAVVEAVKSIIPGELLENIVREGNLKL